MKPKSPARIVQTSLQNRTLHWAYLEFAIRSSTAKTSPKKGPSIPASRNVIEAIRYSYDFLGAAAEFAYQLVKDGPLGDSRTANWLRRYMDREWTKLYLRRTSAESTLRREPSRAPRACWLACDDGILIRFG
jgi:hypothetical protein